MDPIIIAPGFNGPRLSGNGGYVGGVLAERYTQVFGGDGTVEITLRAPIPIARELQVVREGDALMLRDGETLICEARAGSVAHLAAAARADRLERRHAPRRGRRQPAGHRFPLVHRLRPRPRASAMACACCGTAGPQPGTSLSCYVPHPNHADAEGRIRPEFVWGTLDCPGAFAAQDPNDMRPALTGRMTAKVIEPPKVGERCAVVGWRIGADGRKLYSGTALYTESGRLCALGTCTWIVLKS